MNKIITKLQRYFARFFLAILTFILLLSCSKENEKIPFVAKEMHERVAFIFPNGGVYQLKLNGVDMGENIRDAYLDIANPIDIELISDGQVIFSGSQISIPKDKQIAFCDVLGHGIQVLPADRQHTISVSIAEPVEDIQILLKGLEGNPQGVKVLNNEEQILNQDDVRTDKLSVEIRRGEQTLKSIDIKADSRSSKFILTWISKDELAQVTPPTEEQRKLLKEEFDTYFSFIFFEKDFPDHKKLIVELAPDTFMEMDESGYPVAVAEGFEPFSFELISGTPSEFQLVAGYNDGDYLNVVRLYDPNDPNNPLLTLDQMGYIFIYDDYNYSLDIPEGTNYKFRCYQLVPSTSPTYTSSQQRTDPEFVFNSSLSFE